MKFWLATANIERARECLAYGIFEGIITNPTVVAREKTKPEKLFKKLCEISPLAYYQLLESDVDTMLAEAERMLAVEPEKMRIKVPATKNGLAVIKQLSEKGIRVMATAVPTSSWMLFAIAAGAVAIAPYSGMLQRKGIISKMEGVFAMQEIINQQKLDVELCTGIYDVTEIALYAAKGVKSGFIWEKDVENYLTQNLVDEAVAAFKSDSENITNMY